MGTGWYWRDINETEWELVLDDPSMGEDVTYSATVIHHAWNEYTAKAERAYCEGEGTILTLADYGQTSRQNAQLWAVKNWHG